MEPEWVDQVRRAGERMKAQAEAAEKLPPGSAGAPKVYYDAFGNKHTVLPDETNDERVIVNDYRMPNDGPMPDFMPDMQALHAQVDPIRQEIDNMLGGFPQGYVGGPPGHFFEVGDDGDYEDDEYDEYDDYDSEDEEEAMMAWLESGRDPRDFPGPQRGPTMGPPRSGMPGSGPEGYFEPGQDPRMGRGRGPGGFGDGPQQPFGPQQGAMPGPSGTEGFPSGPQAPFMPGQDPMMGAAPPESSRGGRRRGRGNRRGPPSRGGW